MAGTGNAQQAPHVAISIFARGLLKALTTRLYFQDEPLNETDPVLSLIDDASRRRTSDRKEGFIRNLAFGYPVAG